MVIIMSGKQGSGKTTMTKLLVDGHQGHHIKFADPLYEMQEVVWDALLKSKNLNASEWKWALIAGDMADAVKGVLLKYGVNEETLDQNYKRLFDYFHDTFKRTPWHPREKKSGDMLQWLGTEYGRAIDQDIWVNIAKYRIATLLQQDENATVIVDDCRFENEFYALDQFNPLKVRLECDRDVRKSRADAWRDNEFHTSETALDAISSEGSFDLYFDTAEQPVDVVLAEIESAMQDIGIFGELQTSPTTFTHVSNKYFDKGFKQLDDGRNVGTW